MTIAIDTNLANADLVPELAGPPHELFHLWRKEQPVHWNPPPAPGTYHMPQPGSYLEKGFWVLTRHKDVDTVSRDQATFSSHVGTPVIWEMDEQQLALQRAGLMAMPIEQHTQVKRMVMPPFTPRALASFEPEIRRVATEIVDSIADKGSCEFVFDVASKLPVYTFCTLMGIPDALRERVFQLGNALADVETERELGFDPQAEIFGIAASLIEQKRQQPDASMLSAYVNGEVDGERLSFEQIAMFFLTMAIAGHETTRGTAAHFIRLMTEHPDQYALLRSDPARYLPNAIDEVLRCAPPVMQFRRTATKDVIVGGQEIKEGDKIYLAYAAANRDPEVFADPDRFDITRDNAKRHLSFGVGPHMCIGARLAHLQLRLLLEQIVTRIPDFRLAAPPRYLRSIWFNAIIEMPIAFTPEARG